MKLTPSDLGETFAAGILRRRGVNVAEKERLRADWFMGFIVGAVTTSSLSGTGMPWWGVVLGGATAATLGAFSFPDNRKKRQRARPLTPIEIAALRPAKIVPPSVLDQVIGTLLGKPLPPSPSTRTPEDAFVDLLEAVQPLELAADAEATLRSTIQALGNAVSAVPPVAPVDESTITDLVVDAEALLMRSKREPDSVVAASLHRQAEASVRQARALQDAAKIARRTRTLRQEVLVQIETVRASLPSFSQAGAFEASGRMQSLAESVRDVAREAASVTAAQEELVQTLGSDYRVATAASTTDEPQTLRLGRSR